MNPMPRRSYTIGKGIDEYLQTLGNVALESRKIATKSIEAGAGEVTGAIREEIAALPIQQGKFGTAEEKLTGITAAQRQGLLDGLGITMERMDNGVINRKIGFAGYNSTRTEKNPNGQPNTVIARSLISGTSFRQKSDFIGRAVRKSKAAAESKMKTTFDNALKDAMKG